MGSLQLLTAAHARPRPYHLRMNAASQASDDGNNQGKNIGKNTISGFLALYRVRSTATVASPADG